MERRKTVSYTHLIGLKSNNGAEILIHIGMDTVNMNGKGFDVKVQQGQAVKKGDLLVEVDLQEIADAGYDDIIPVILTNTVAYDQIIPMEYGKKEEQENIIELKVKK